MTTALSAALHPFLASGELLRALRAPPLSAETAADLLRREPAELARHTGVDDVEVWTAIRSACLSCCPQGALACGLWDAARARASASARDGGGDERRLRTGVRALDSLLGGGLRPGRLYELYGPAGAGKTQLGLTLAARCCANDGGVSRIEGGGDGGDVGGGGVAWVDANGNFRVGRLAEMLRSNWRQLRGRRGVLDRVRVLRARDLSTVERELRRAVRAAERGPIHGYDARSSLTADRGPIHGQDGGSNLTAKRGTIRGHGVDEAMFWLTVRLIVVDSVAALVLPELGMGGGTGRAFRGVERVVRLLRRLAALSGAAVLVCNHATTSSSSSFAVGGDDGDAAGSGAAKLRPSLGRIFSAAADVRLFVSRDSGNIGNVNVDGNGGVNVGNVGGGNVGNINVGNVGNVGVGGGGVNVSVNVRDVGGNVNVGNVSGVGGERIVVLEKGDAGDGGGNVGKRCAGRIGAAGWTDVEG